MAKRFRMFVIAFMLFVLAVGLCVVVIRKTSRATGVSLHDALVWLGLAEVPLPRTSRRRR